MLTTALEKDKYLRQAKQSKHHRNITWGGKKQEHYIKAYNKINL